MIESVVARSIAAGAELVTGGSVPERPGFYYPPDDPRLQHGHGRFASSEELFGPVLSVV